MITVKAKADADNDPDYMNLAFGGTPPAEVFTTGEVPTTRVTLTDNNRVTVSFSEDEYDVDEGSSVPVVVNIAPRPDSDQSIPVTYSPSGRSLPDGVTVQVGGTDFASGDRLTLTGGTGTITVTAAEETDEDFDDHTITFRLGARPTNTIYGEHQSATVTIEDNDDPVPPQSTLTFDRPTYSVGEGSSVTLAVNLTPAASDEVTVAIASTFAGDNAALADYKLNGDDTGSIELKFDAGERRKTITLSAEADDDITNETVTVTIQGATSDSNVAVGTQNDTMVTLRDDGQHRVTLTSSATEIFEGATNGTETATLTVTLGPSNATRAFTVPITVSPSSGDFELAGC